jgi:hypothetical protein
MVGGVTFAFYNFQKAKSGSTFRATARECDSYYRLEDNRIGKNKSRQKGGAHIGAWWVALLLPFTISKR